MKGRFLSKRNSLSLEGTRSERMKSIRSCLSASQLKKYSMPIPDSSMTFGCEYFRKYSADRCTSRFPIENSSG